MGWQVARTGCRQGMKTQEPNSLPAALLPETIASHRTFPEGLTVCLYPCLFLLELCCHEAGEALQLKMSTLEKGCFLAQDWLLLHSSGARWSCTCSLSSWDYPISVILFSPNPALFQMNSCPSQYKADRTTNYVTMCLHMSTHSPE